jgi:8-oxo-dGTP pyrophosphatase MutT (NUDIX family)
MEHKYQSFHITTKGLIFHRNKFLLTQSDDPEYFGSLECPGGRINPKEILDVAIVRELQEELNVDLSSIPHTIDLFTLNQRDEVEYDWDDKFTQIIEVYYKIVIPDEYDFTFELVEEASGFIWVDKTTNLDEYPYRVLSRKDVYKKAQKTLI